jgi:hypothetical protein
MKLISMQCAEEFCHENYIKKTLQLECKKGRHLLAKYTVTQKVETAPSTRAGN